MSAPSQLFIDGTWRPASDGEVIEIIDPATEEVVGSVPRATSDDVEEATQAAAKGFATWRETDPWSRTQKLRAVADWIGEHKEEIAAVLTEEQGKTLGEALGEVTVAGQYFDWYADEARRQYGRLIPTTTNGAHLYTLRQPIGPVAAFTPWNFPIVLAARKVAAALAAGCSVILKPAEEAPRSALYLARACEQVGLPAGVFNVITGDPEAISTQLLATDTIRKASFTGSVPVGQQLLRQAAEGVKEVSLELGGHAPFLVFEDADLDPTIEACVQGKFRNGGQVCIAPSRLFVAAPMYEAFTDRFSERVGRLKVGDGRDPSTDVGPLANLRRLEGVESLVENAVDRGATLRKGGGRPDGLDRGLYFEPTVLSEVTDDMRLMTEEPFGPVVPVVSFEDIDEVIARANRSDYGLAGYVFTRDLRTAHRAAEALEVGMVGVNTLGLARPEAPFGGVKHSGLGREGGIEGIEAYTVTKYVNMAL